MSKYIPPIEVTLEIINLLDKYLVHCKECKHYYGYSTKWGVCEYTREYQGKALDVSPEHFCGWAERRQ